MSHAVHKITHGISHAFHEVVHHPLESLAVVGGSLLIPGVGSAVGSTLGLTSSAATGLASAGTMADTALGASAVASGTIAGATGVLGTLESASKIANIAGAGASVLGAMSKPKVNIPNPNLPIQAKPQAKKAPVIGTQKISLLGNVAEGLFGRTKTVFDNSNFGKNVSSYKLSDVFSLL